MESMKLLIIQECVLLLRYVSQVPGVKFAVLSISCGKGVNKAIFSRKSSLWLYDINGKPKIKRDQIRRSLDGNTKSELSKIGSGGLREISFQRAK